MSAAANHPFRMNDESSAFGGSPQVKFQQYHHPSHIHQTSTHRGASSHCRLLCPHSSHKQAPEQTPKTPPSITNTSSPHPNQHTSPSPNSQPPTTACPHHSSQQMKKGKGRGERRATRNATPRSQREDYREARIPHSQQNAASKNTFNPEPPKNTIRVSPNRPNLPLP